MAQDFAADAQPLKPYTTPRLETFGSVSELSAQGSGSYGYKEGGKGKKKKKGYGWWW